MKWFQFDAYCLESVCGRYTVDRAKVGDVLRYTAWLRGKPPVNLGCFDTSDEARKGCAEHDSAQQVAA
jgi:hypothetical protein